MLALVEDVSVVWLCVQWCWCLKNGGYTLPHPYTVDSTAKPKEQSSCELAPLYSSYGLCSDFHCCRLCVLCNKYVQSDASFTGGL